jgi:hypothetical protein
MHVLNCIFNMLLAAHSERIKNFISFTWKGSLLASTFWVLRSPSWCLASNARPVCTSKQTVSNRTKQHYDRLKGWSIQAIYSVLISFAKKYIDFIWGFPSFKAHSRNSVETYHICRMVLSCQRNRQKSCIQEHSIWYQSSRNSTALVKFCHTFTLCPQV